jgi:hypothetical protein
MFELSVFKFPSIHKNKLLKKQAISLALSVFPISMFKSEILSGISILPVLFLIIFHVVFTLFIDFLSDYCNMISLFLLLLSSRLHSIYYNNLGFH